MPTVDAVAVAVVETVPSSPPPLFRVSEIYYQPEGGSMAVVDDLPVMEGTILNGALVEQILADRVRLIVDGLAVEVPLAETPSPVQAAAKPSPGDGASACRRLCGFPFTDTFRVTSGMKTC